MAGIFEKHPCDTCRRPIGKLVKRCGKCSIVKAHDLGEGETALTDDGYVRIVVNGKFVSEHRHVMEQVLGRKLVKGESVHHVDGDRTNNDPDNLELWVKYQPYGQRGRDLTCPHCHRNYSD